MKDLEGMIDRVQEFSSTNMEIEVKASQREKLAGINANSKEIRERKEE